MKRFTYLVTAFFLTITMTVNAQWDLGVIGGLNISTLEADADISSQWNWGAGAVVDYYFTENIAVRVEPMYLIKGGIKEAENDDPRIDISLSVIEVPILFKYDFGTSDKFYLIAGPSIGYVLSNEIVADIQGFSFTADVTDLTEEIDFSAALGCGVSAPVGIAEIFIEAKYTYGFTNLQKGGTFEAESGPLKIQGEMDKEVDKYKTRGFQLMAGVTFPL
ncbi:MAG: PorT family protein [Melioribacteraceae bacterium]|nr:PorT family protein [Melioribacteraceae bacterium]